MLKNDFFKDVNNFVFNLLKKELSSKVVYHNYNHTLSVVKATNEIALGENISNEELEIVLLAAWFHDTGFTKDASTHETDSLEIAEEYLTEKGFDAAKIKEVLLCIDATKMPQKPISKLGEIICDADLFHLGSESFNEKSNLLRSEWELLSDKHLSDTEWLNENIKFIGEHK